MIDSTDFLSERDKLVKRMQDMIEELNSFKSVADVPKDYPPVAYHKNGYKLDVTGIRAAYVAANRAARTDSTMPAGPARRHAIWNALVVEGLSRAEVAAKFKLSMGTVIADFQRQLYREEAKARSAPAGTLFIGTEGHHRTGRFEYFVKRVERDRSGPGYHLQAKTVKGPFSNPHEAYQNQQIIEQLANDMRDAAARRSMQEENHTSVSD